MLAQPEGPALLPGSHLVPLGIKLAPSMLAPSMSSTLLTRLKGAWQQRERPALRLALTGVFLVLLGVVAHVARQGTGEARLLAASLLIGALLLTVAGWLYDGRHWRSERSVLRRILF